MKVTKVVVDELPESCDKCSDGSRRINSIGLLDHPAIRVALR